MNKEEFLKKILDEFEEDFDWREIQFDAENYVPTKETKQFLTRVINRVWKNCEDKLLKRK